MKKMILAAAAVVFGIFGVSSAMADSSGSYTVIHAEWVAPKTPPVGTSVLTLPIPKAEEVPGDRHFFGFSAGDDAVVQVNTPNPGGLGDSFTGPFNTPQALANLNAFGQICPPGATSDSLEDCPAAYSSISTIVKEKEQAMTEQVACPGNYSGDDAMECLHFTAELLAQIGKGIDSHDFSTNVEASADVNALITNLKNWMSQQNPGDNDPHLMYEAANLQFKATVLSMVLENTFDKIAKERAGLN